MELFNKLRGQARDAANIQALAGSAQLNKALQNYVREVNSVIKSGGAINNARVRSYLSGKVGNNNKMLKNRLSNGIANIVSASRVALPKAAQAAVGVAPVAPAVNAVNNAAAQARRLKFNAIIAEMEAAGLNANKLKSIKAKMNLLGFKPNNMPNNLRAKYNSLNARIAALETVRNANTLTGNSNQQKINSVLTNLRNLQTRVPNNMRSMITNKIGNVERISLLKMPGNNKGARAANMTQRLWSHAGEGFWSNTPEGGMNAFHRAQTNANLKLNGLTRANINAILNSPNFSPPTNRNGNNRSRHVGRVRKLLNKLGLK
jgi:hypothetical protein